MTAVITICGLSPVRREHYRFDGKALSQYESLFPRRADTGLNSKRKPIEAGAGRLHPDCGCDPMFFF